MILITRGLCATCVSGRRPPGATYCPTCGRRAGLVRVKPETLRAAVVCPGPARPRGGTVVLLARWLRADGEVVLAGEALCELEGEEAVIEVESPTAGVLRHFKPVGEAVRVGESLGWVSRC